MHEGGGRWVGSNKLVELKKKKKLMISSSQIILTSRAHCGRIACRGIFADPVQVSASRLLFPELELSQSRGQPR